MHIMNLNKIKRETSARFQLIDACKQVGGVLQVDYETGEVACKLPNDKEIRAIDDITVEIYDPNIGTEEIQGLVRIVPGQDRITVVTDEGEEVDLEL